VPASTPLRASELEGVPLAQRADVLLDRALEHGALPESTQKLMDLTRRDDAEVGPVVDALALNPGLAAAVLRVANSPLYGQQRAVSDLKRAVGLIGMQELHDIIAGTAMMAAFSTADPLSQKMQGAAVLSASVARVLASKLKLNAASASAAYLSGLMCELGALACLALDPEFAELYGTTANDPRARFDVEAGRYGGSTPDIGGRILKASSLPADVTQAVGTTGLEPGEHAPSLGRVVAFARLAAVILMSAAEHGDALKLREELDAAANTVGLEKVDPELLFSASLTAAAEAELTLRGELGLSQTAPSNDVSPASSTAPGARPSSATKPWWKKLLG
jgi:HD-like signal output (HDOD) protein